MERDLTIGKGAARRVIFVVVLCIMAGCSQNLYNLNDKTPLDVPPPQVQRPVGTIWPGENSANTLFADRKARHVNDIVTIIIAESSTGANNAKTTTSRDADTKANIGGAFQTGPDRTLLSKYDGGGGSKNSLKGDGATSRNSTLTGRISARVVKILSNGNLYIEGKRQLTINAEDQYLVVSGVVRPEDISIENTVASYSISDAKIFYTGKGVVDDKLRPGWLTRLVDWVWPF